MDADTRQAISDLAERVQRLENLQRETETVDFFPAIPAPAIQHCICGRDEPCGVGPRFCPHTSPRAALQALRDRLTGPQEPPRPYEDSPALRAMERIVAARAAQPAPEAPAPDERPIGGLHGW